MISQYLHFCFNFVKLFNNLSNIVLYLVLPFEFTDIFFDLTDIFVNWLYFGLNLYLDIIEQNQELTLNYLSD